MPIEIKELIIRMTVKTTPPKSDLENESLISSIDKREIVSECVEMIMDKLIIESLR